MSRRELTRRIVMAAGAGVCLILSLVLVLTAADVVGKKVTTIEGLAPEGGLHPVQEAWLEEDVAQCGFCQPGQIMQAAALLDSKRSPSDADIDQIMNVCRCGRPGSASHHSSYEIQRRLCRAEANLRTIADEP